MPEYYTRRRRTASQAALSSTKGSFVWSALQSDRSVLQQASLAREFIASYGEMSRRSGYLSAVARSAKVDAAEADNHSDISPHLESTSCERSWEDYRHAGAANFEDALANQYQSLMDD
jgi:hypothetical protein